MPRSPWRTRSWLASIVGVFTVVSCLVWVPNLYAQGAGNSTVIGTVGDNSGIIPGAVVTLTETATGVVRTSTTNETGTFRFAALPPGVYALKVTLDNFKPITVDNFTVDAGAIRDLGKLTLVPGNLEETVEVKAEVTPVQVSTSARVASVTADQLQNIQMKGRDIYGFLAVVPGVQDSNFSRDFTSWTSANNITINGAPVTSNNIMIDGIAQRDEYGTNAFVNPNIDAIGEVQVVATGYTAENGRSNGGLVNFVTKSGTSVFRGSGWYNAKRDSWVANDYLRKRQGASKPLYRVNIGGFAAGGPVIIPKMLDSRTSQKKVFFFGSQEFTKDARPTQTATANYPTDLERIGDFSQTRLTTTANYGAIQPIIDYKTGLPFPGNIIPPDRINPTGQKLLNLLAKPNGYVQPGANQQFNANFIGNETPEHNRIDYVYRVDVALSNRWRFNYKVLADQENNIRVNEFSPGVGKSNNTVPAWQTSGTLTTVITPTMVNELNAGFAINHYNQRGFPNDYDYKQFYCANVGVCPPRIAPYGAYYGFNDPPQNASCAGSIDGKQLDQYPYLPIFTTSGGNRTGLAGYSPALTNGRVMPTCNHDRRYVFQDDLSKTVGRHNLKFGFYWENDETHAPVSGTMYMGNFNFGSSNTNPLDSGNGYANMLLGVITQYQEVTNRIAWNIGHSEVDAYAQDSWRVSPRLTLDYGLRITHIPSWYETNKMTAAFYPELYDRSKAVRLYRPVCTNGALGNVACPSANQAAIDPANPGVFLPFQLAGTVVPNSGVLTNGIKADGRNNDGSYYDYNNIFWGPRIGIAWDVRGDHREAIRASAGLFYDFPRGGNSAFIGVPPVSFTQVVNNLTMDQLAAFSSGGALTFSQNPVGGPAATVQGDRHTLPTSYQVNVAYQRDIGFSTTAEVAYVGNFTRHDRRTYNLDVLPLYVFADPNNQFNQAALSQNYLFTKFRGMANITDFTNDLESLRYHSMQVSVQRRLSHGLQMGLAYTLSKGMGMQGWDPYTADPNLTINMGGKMVQGGKDALRERYWGPTAVDRRHNLTINYSYLVPTLFADNRLTRAVFENWQVSGVTKLLSGTAVNPTCQNTTTRGVQYSLPSYTNGIASAANSITGRCNLTGAPIDAGTRVDVDPSNPDPLTARYFNLAAFAMPTPLSATVGDFGNAPLGLLRNPTVSEWDVTLERRFPVGNRRGLRFLLQAYNLFNQVEWTTLNAALTFTGTTNVQSSTTAGTYSTVNPINPRQIGLSLRFDF
jgi:Carboxypeptidase regulatory-like domain/TonB-dependent Receptor Plug Domain